MKIQQIERPPNLSKCFFVFQLEELFTQFEAVESVEAADEFARELNVGDLVFANRDDEALSGVGIDDDVGGLQRGIAEEAVGVEVPVLDIVEGFLVGGNALEPAERRDHGEKEMEFGVFGNERLLEDDGLRGVEAGGEIVDGDLQRVFGDGGGVGVVAGERVPVGNEIETFVGRIGLKLDPVLKSAEVVADVETAGGAHAGEDPVGGGGVGQKSLASQRAKLTVYSLQSTAPKQNLGNGITTEVAERP